MDKDIKEGNFMEDKKMDVKYSGVLEKPEGKKKMSYMDEAEFRFLDAHYKMINEMNRIQAMIEYANPKKRKEYQKWLEDNFIE